MPRILPQFVDLDELPNLRDLCLFSTGKTPNLGLGFYPDTDIFQGYSSSLRRVLIKGPFVFAGFSSLSGLLTRVSANTLRSLSLHGVKFGYNPDDVPWSLDSQAWLDMP